MVEDAKRRHGRLEFCQTARAATGEAQIGRELKSLFSDVLSEPLPDSFLRALQALEELGSECPSDPSLKRDATPNPADGGERPWAPRRNAARIERVGSPFVNSDRQPLVAVGGLTSLWRRRTNCPP